MSVATKRNIIIVQETKVTDLFIKTKEENVHSKVPVPYFKGPNIYVNEIIM